MTLCEYSSFSHQTLRQYTRDISYFRQAAVVRGCKFVLKDILQSYSCLLLFQAASSRSHAVFQVHIRMVNIKIGSKRTVRLSMINLGGIDKVSPVWDYNLKKTPALIIFSLIGNCVNKLADGLKHIPYRGCDLYSHIKGLLGKQSPDLNGNPCVNEFPNLRGNHTTTTPFVQKKNFSCLYCKNGLKSVESKELYVNKRMLYLIRRFPKAARQVEVTSDTYRCRIAVDPNEIFTIKGVQAKKCLTDNGLASSFQKFFPI